VTLGFDCVAAAALLTGFGGNELTCFPLDVRLTKELKTPQNLSIIGNDD
jgi:hypothetical protein